MKPVVKICGLRRAGDAGHAVSLGATFAGCVLAKDSPRCATFDEVRAVRDAVCQEAQTVLVFRHPTRAEILEAVERTGVRCVQVHGAPAALLESLAREGVATVRVWSVDEGAETLPETSTGPGCLGLLDTGAGGTGRPFPWGLLPCPGPEYLFVAGGIRPDNVGELLRRQPWGLDVSSGIERSPGTKDRAATAALFAALAEAP